MREALELVETHLEAGEPAEALLTFVAGADLQLPEEEVRAACRRAMLVLAAGGDPHRELELDSPAVEALARDLDAPGRREDLQRALQSLRDATADLVLTSALRSRLEDDRDLAWHAFALALLAEELGEE